MSEMESSEGTWQQQLSASFTTLPALCDYLGLDLSQAPKPIAQQTSFPLRVPRPFAARMRRQDWSDPLLAQVLPWAEEAQALPGYSLQPLQEDQYSPLPGLLHKYHGRVLWIMAGGCAINCRYCFRRHFPYSEQGGRRQWPAIIDAIAADHSITEVILSGGDPLMVEDEPFLAACRQLAAIEQVTTVRIHTRLPVVIPSRLTDTLINGLKQLSCQVVLVLHSNHPNEWGEVMSAAVLRAQPLCVLNQSVLLRGINDQAEVLVRLSRQMFAAGCLPYYLHLLDPVLGAHHFHVPLEEAKQILSASAALLPGYLMPRLARELPGQSAKQVLSY